MIEMLSKFFEPKHIVAAVNQRDLELKGWRVLESPALK
jgi:hypothetical protein